MPRPSWWREVCAIGAALMAKMPSGGRLAGMCVSGVGPCLVLCDDDLRPLRPAILYGVDTRATAEIHSLTEEFGETQHPASGRAPCCPARRSARSWSGCDDHEPEVFERATGWYGSNSYIAAKLTGEYVMDHHTASQCDPLYATREFDWNQRVGNADLPSSAAAAPGVAERCRRNRDGGRGGSHRDTRGHTGCPRERSMPTRRRSRSACGDPGDQMLMYGSTMFLVQIIDEYHSDPDVVDDRGCRCAAASRWRRARRRRAA